MRIQNTQKPRMKSTTRSAREPIPSPAAQPYTFQPATAQPTATGNPSSTATRYSTSARRCRPRQAEVKLQMQNPNMVRTAGISSLPILRPHQHRFKKKKHTCPKDFTPARLMRAGCSTNSCCAKSLEHMWRHLSLPLFFQPSTASSPASPGTAFLAESASDCSFYLVPEQS